jgi:hypothetical protein
MAARLAAGRTADLAGDSATVRPPVAGQQRAGNAVGMLAAVCLSPGEAQTLREQEE